MLRIEILKFIFRAYFVLERSLSPALTRITWLAHRLDSAYSRSARSCAAGRRHTHLGPQKRSLNKVYFYYFSTYKRILELFQLPKPDTKHLGPSTPHGEEQQANDFFGYYSRWVGGRANKRCAVAYCRSNKEQSELLCSSLVGSDVRYFTPGRETEIPVHGKVVGREKHLRGRSGLLIFGFTDYLIGPARLWI